MSIFVEKDRENVGLIHRNAAILRYEGRIRVRHADAYRWVRSYQPVDDQPTIAFLDPPYRDYESRTSQVNQLVTALVEKLPGGSAIALEAGRGLRELGLSETDWDLRRYGNKRVAIRMLPEVGQGAGTGTAAAGDDTPPPTEES